MREFLDTIEQKRNLTEEESFSAMSLIVKGTATTDEIQRFMLAFNAKDITPEELLGFVKAARKESHTLRVENNGAIDMCGTGGDGYCTFNISTIASFSVAGAGITVAKHGNRSVSSKCGSADILEALGVNITISPDRMRRCINEVGIGFLYSPLFFPFLRTIAEARSRIKKRTVFNIVMPLLNPARVKRQLVGVCDKKTGAAVASAFKKLARERVLVISAHDGMDEASLDVPSWLWTVERDQSLSFETVTYLSFGLMHRSKELICGGDAKQNAVIAYDVLRGAKSAYRDYVIANAALGIIAGGATNSLRNAADRAAESIDSGRALKKLSLLREFSIS